MNLKSKLDKWLGAEPIAQASQESVVTESAEPETPQEIKETLFDELAKKWVVGKTVVAIEDVFGEYYSDNRNVILHKAGDKGKILFAGPDELRTSDYHGRVYNEWVNFRVKTELGETTLARYERERPMGSYSLFPAKNADEWSEWKYEMTTPNEWNRRTFVLEEEEAQFATQIERWKNPQLSFKIRRLEGRSPVTVWFSHRAYAEGFVIVKQPSGKPVEFDNIEEARAAVEILKTRKNPKLIENFSRQYEDVEGEFYTVETIQ